MTWVTPRLMILMALRGSVGMQRWRASPLPEPEGMMARAVCVCITPHATSLTVPSPPMAHTMSMPSRAAVLANSVAWPTCWVMAMV